MNKNALTAALSLACMEIRSRNEEAINSTQNRIYSLKNWFSTRVSNDQKYLCNCRLCVCINTRKLKGLDSRKIRSLPEIKKVIDMAHHFIACSSHDPFTYKINVYLQHPTIAVLLIKILLFFSTTVVFTCSKVINAFKRFVDRPVVEKL